MSEYIYGKNTVREAIKSRKNIYQIYLTNYNKEFISLANNYKITYKLVRNNELDKLIKGNHQGIVAEVLEYRYYSLDEIIFSAKNKHPLFVILDGLKDPHNLGAILRICDATGVDGVIIPKNRSVSLNNTVAKVSTGAIEYVKVSEVTNITNAIKKLKEKGFWIIGAEAKGNAVFYDEVDYQMPIALVIGSEGKGISRLVLDNCDYIIKIPMLGHVNSLNASVSCGVLLYEIIRKRKE